VGDIRYSVMSDGGFAYPPAVLFPSLTPDELTAALGDSLTDEGLLFTPYNCGLVESGGALVLLDAGMGPVAAEVGAPAGRLLVSLRERGIQPEDIDIVVISHAHLDHVGGVMTNGSPRFPMSRHLLSRDEWSFWMTDECERRLPADYAESLIGAARGHLPVLHDAGLLELIDGETDVVAGVKLLPAPGHTPGHMSVSVSTEEESVLYLADVFLHELNLRHPDWISVVDVDAELTIATRMRLFDQAAVGRSVVTAFHVGETGRIQKQGDAYAYEGKA
jgi:glyoxylase-like metal-dependent hydrolase (beta-lactamase superfamily II)